MDQRRRWSVNDKQLWRAAQEGRADDLHARLQAQLLATPADANTTVAMRATVIGEALHVASCNDHVGAAAVFRRRERG
jgi:hypothetical protein